MKDGDGSVYLGKLVIPSDQEVEALSTSAGRSLQQFNRLLAEQREMERVSAKEAGTIGFMCRGLVQATLPHRITKKDNANEFTRTNGNLTLTIIAPSGIGIPYGGMPRMLTAFMNTEAISQKSPEIDLGRSMRSFMMKLGYAVDGRTQKMMKDQALKLFSSTIHMTYMSDGPSRVKKYDVADEAMLWWEPMRPDQESLWNSYVRLSPAYFKELVEHPVPIDLRALILLKASPMAIDIYCWITYRMSYLRDDVTIPWELLQAQFGAGYADIYDFKKNFKANMKKVIALYPQANVDEVSSGIKLTRSPTHVPMQKNITKGISFDD